MRIRAVTALGISLLVAQGAAAQVTAENAVAQATDGFGFRSGAEVVGLYDPYSVRGFSPTAANNIRILGLYADLQADPSARLAETATIRVGSAALGSPLVAPSGVVDYGLRRRAQSGLGVRFSREPFGQLRAEMDGGWRSDDGRLALLGGIGGGGEGDDFRGTRPRHATGALIAAWRPAAQVDLTGFYDRSWSRRRVEPYFYTAGPFAPPRVERGLFLGESWSDYEVRSAHAGLVANAALGSRVSLEAGLFRSTREVEADTFDLYFDVDRAGLGQRTLYLLAPQIYASTSGEARLAHGWDGGGARQRIGLGYRFRRSRARYGGEREIVLGAGDIFAPRAFPAPLAQPFGPRTDDRTQQDSFYATYRLQSEGWEVDASLGLIHYRKEVALPGVAPRANTSSPHLYSVLVGWHPGPSSLIYASASRGLEASGVAPSAAANRNAVLPAIVTRQAEAGLRVPLGRLQAVASLFEIRKPYAGLRPDGLFAIDGTIAHRGVEGSLAGSPAEGVTIVAGLLVLEGRVRGGLVDRGLLSRVPIALPDHQAQVAVDWAPAGLGGLSFDLVATRTGRRSTRLDGGHSLGSDTFVDLGARYRFRVSEAPVLLRLQLLNAFDRYAFTVGSDGAFFYVPGRSVRLALSAEL